MNHPIRPAPASRIVPLPEAPLGSRLAEPVLDAQGHTLLAAGTELADGMVRSLLRRGIETVCVLEASPAGGTDGPGGAAALEAERDEVKRQVEHLFRHGLQPSRINPLLHLVLSYRLESLS